MFLFNRATQIAALAALMFCACLWVLGSDATRDLLDFASILVAVVLSARFVPEALDRFRRGMQLREWVMVVSHGLFWPGWACFRGWAFAVRAADRPDWMIDSPLNAVFIAWILAAAVLNLYGSAPVGHITTDRRVYYIGLGIAAGILIGVIVSRLLNLR